jgi:SAM-dependent methyltransferase
VQRGFEDHFSTDSPGYRANRPGYPDGLFDHLASVAPRRELAWDCATGSGQAANGLAHHFRRVIATDASTQQITSAVSHPKIEYRVATAEHSGLGDHSVDLCTVAQSLHWFDLDPFYREVNRVLVAGGVLAVWSYNLLTVTPALDAVIRRLYHDIVGPWWPPQRRLVERGYADIPFPFEPLPAPRFKMHAQWQLAQLAGYLRTWSAVQRYLQERGEDPVTAVELELQAAWGEPTLQRRVQWPLALRLGRTAT